MSGNAQRFMFGVLSVVHCPIANKRGAGCPSSGGGVPRVLTAYLCNAPRNSFYVRNYGYNNLLKYIKNTVL